ncbi:unnamed protein product, partial [marine sediment metagenome]
MAYAALTQDDLTKWWITGTGSGVNRLSEVMDDAPDGPAVFYLDAADAWTQNGATDEWYVAAAAKPDNVSENLAGWRNMTDAGDDAKTGTNYFPTSFNLVASSGTVIAGDYTKLAVDDGDYHQIEEETGTPCLDFDYSWSGLPTSTLPDKVHLNGYYDGNPAHDVFIYAWDYDGTQWVRLTAAAQDFPDAAADDDYTFDMPSVNPGYYFDSGAAKIRINHTSGGSAGHDFYVDYLRLYISTEVGLASDEWSYDNNNSRVYIQLSDDSDPNDTDVRLDYAWPFFMTETVEDGVYLIHQNFEVGDDTTSTTLKSLSEMVRFDDTFYPIIQTNATLEIGELHASYGRRPSYWSISGAPNGTANILNGGNLSIYASIFENRSSSDHVFDTGVLTIKNSI